MRLLRNFLSLAAGEVLSKLLTFAAFAYLARVMGASGFGFIEFSCAALMCASLIVDQGFSAFGAREIAKTPALTSKLAVEIVTVRFILAAGGYLAIVLFTLLSSQPPVLVRLLLVYGLSICLTPLLLQWVFQGHDQMSLVAVIQVIRQSVFATVVFMFVRGPEQIVLVAWAEVSAVGVAAAFSIWAYWRRFGSTTRLRPTVSQQLFSQGVPIGLSQMFWVAKLFGGTLILGVIAVPQIVGFYGGAQRVLVALHAFVWLYYLNLLPSMARSWQQGSEKFSLLIERSMHAVVWIAVAVGMVWAAFSSDAIKLIYGPEFAAGGKVLALFAAVWAMAFISGHYRFGLIAAGYQKAEMMTSAFGAALALVLIPAGYFKVGINGAAAGLVIAEAGVWLSSWWFAKRLLNLRGNARLLQRPFFAAILIAASFAWLPIGSQNARLALGMLLLAVLPFALDHTARERARELLAAGRSLRERRLSQRIVDA